MKFKQEIDLRRSEIATHVTMVARYVQALAKNYGLDRFDIEVIGMAAIVHDIGKLCIPQEILYKREPLKPQDWALISSHPLYGGKFFEFDKESFLIKRIRDVAMYHHERWDGTGYPEGLAGDDIPLFARLMAIADVFDALTSKRSYKEPWAVHDVIKFINERAGDHFDPYVVTVFNRSIPEFISIHDTYNYSSPTAA